MLLCISSFAPVAAASKSAKYKAAEKKYLAYINKNRTGYGSYEIVDVDSNGIPELLISNKKTWKNELYTYNAKTKKMIKLKSLHMGNRTGGSQLIQYSRSKHTVMLLTGDTKSYTYYIYKVKGTKASLVLKASASMDWRTRKTTYKLNGAMVSRTKFNSKWKSYLKGGKYLSKTA